MPEGPIAHGELAALTRRFEEVAEKHDREFGIIKSDLTAVRLQIDNLDQKVEALDEKIDRKQACRAWTGPRHEERTSSSLVSSGWSTAPAGAGRP
ncbi:hypothetical protein ACWFQ8_12110 [Streptomyces sp. NPDC055254]